jgi:ATP-dependent Clp protease, protease subunit
MISSLKPYRHLSSNRLPNVFYNTWKRSVPFLLVGTGIAISTATALAEFDDKKEKEKEEKKKKKKKKEDDKMPDPNKWLLHKSRVVLLFGKIEEKTASYAISRMLFLDGKSEKDPIVVMINSGGGQINSGLAIYDVMKSLRCPVYTICTGRCSSMAAVLLAGGTKGCRGALPHSSVMIHDAHSSYGKTVVRDIKIKVAELNRKNEVLVSLMAQDSGCTKEKMRNMMQRDFYMTAQEAKEIGLIDFVMDRPILNLTTTSAAKKTTASSSTDEMATTTNLPAEENTQYAH